MSRRDHFEFSKMTMSSINASIALSISCAIVLGACGQQESSEFSTLGIEGLAIPGRLADAKKSGFSDCHADYYAYICERRIKAMVFGVTPARAYVVLNGKTNFVHGIPAGGDGDVRSIPLKDLSYREVNLEFTAVDESRSSNNIQSLSPTSGTGESNNSVQHFMSYLRKTGWSETEWRSYVTFIRSGVPLEISVKPSDNQATIRPETLDIIQERIQIIGKEARQHSQNKRSAEAFFEEMNKKD